MVKQNGRKSKKMENKQIYQQLVKKYKATAEEFNKETITTIELGKVQGRLEDLTELDMLFIGHIEDLSLDELTKLRHYRDLTNAIYRNNLELSWHGRF